MTTAQPAPAGDRLRGLAESVPTLIEQAIARGGDTLGIAAELALPVALVRAVRQKMDAAVAEDDPETVRRAAQARAAEQERRRLAANARARELYARRKAARERADVLPRIAAAQRTAAAEETARIYSRARCQTRGRVLTRRGERYAVREAVRAAS